MALSDYINKVDSGSQIYGTAQETKDINFSLARDLWFFERGTKILKSATFDKAYVDNLITQGKLVILKGVKVFTPSTAENTKQEYTNGEKSLARLGLMEATATFESGIGLYRALRSMEGNDLWDFALVDDTDKMFLEESDTYLSGFEVPYLSAEGTVFNDGSNNSNKSIMFQLRDTRAFDLKMSVLDADELDFSFIKDIKPIRELSYTIDTIPSNADTTVLVTVNSDVNTSIDVASLTGTDNASIQVYVNGVAATVSGVAESGKVKTITIPALATGQEVYVISSPFASNDNIFQAQKSNTVTVA